MKGSGIQTGSLWMCINVDDRHGPGILDINATKRVVDGWIERQELLVTFQWTHRLHSPHTAASFVYSTRIMPSRDERNWARCSCTRRVMTRRIVDRHSNDYITAFHLAGWPPALKANYSSAASSEEFSTTQSSALCCILHYTLQMCCAWTKSGPKNVPRSNRSNVAPAFSVPGTVRHDH